jgi:hypothetical protein
MFRTTFCPSPGALLNCSRSLRFPYRSQGGCVSCRGLFVASRGLFFSQQTDHSKKHIHLGFYTGTGGCGCSSKVLLVMGKMLSETC